jgi:DNA-binding CsgD family transcriptional regulator
VACAVPGGVELVRFAQSLSAAATHEELRSTFLAGFGRLLGVPMYGYSLVDATGRPVCVANGNVSDTFVARYERDARDVDPVLERAYATGRPTYNMALMSPDEWVESAVYRKAYRVHDVRHLVEVPVLSAGKVAGNVHFATSSPEWDLGPGDIEVADALGTVLGVTLTAIATSERVQRELDQALTALTIAGTPYAVSDPRSTELRLNDVARRLLADVIGAEERLHRLMARPVNGGGQARRVHVALVTGEAGVIHGHLSHVGGEEDGALVAVLELERERLGIDPALLAVLTPREQEVAVLVVEGLANREIAAQLFLSQHTVGQHVKRIYRKLGVDSRVALTRTLLSR